MDRNHFLWHLGKRPEGCRYWPRLCLLKGCERPFWPRHWRCHYCSAACRQAARRWRRWRASQDYRATENGKQQRREQSKRYRQRVRERATASADEAAPREGRRRAPGQEIFSLRACRRPGCYQLFHVKHEHSNQRFCSVACCLALRRVLDREARYQARRRRWRRQRLSRRTPPPDSS